MLLINNGSVEIWDLTKEDEKPTQEIRNNAPILGKLIFYELTQLLFVQYSLGTVGFRNPITGGKLRNWEIETCADAPIGEMPPTIEVADGLLAMTCEQELSVWDIASGEKVWSQSYPGSDVIWLSAGPDLSSISVFQYKNNVTRVDFINIKTQEEIHSLAFQGISDDISFHQDLMMQALASQGKVHLPASLEEVKIFLRTKSPMDLISQLLPLVRMRLWQLLIYPG